MYVPGPNAFNKSISSCKSCTGRQSRQLTCPLLSFLKTYTVSICCNKGSSSLSGSKKSGGTSYTVIVSRSSLSFSAIGVHLPSVFDEVSLAEQCADCMPRQRVTRENMSGKLWRATMIQRVRCSFNQLSISKFGIGWESIDSPP